MQELRFLYPLATTKEQMHDASAEVHAKIHEKLQRAWKVTKNKRFGREH